MMRKTLSALLFTALLVGSIVAPFASVAGASTASPPDGMVSVPDGNVGPPSPGPSINEQNGGGTGPRVGLPSNVPTHASAWDVRASDHAGDLEVTVGEVDGALALVFTDDRNHEGRKVAVDASTFVESVGHRPEMAYGYHEDGSRWTAPISYEDGSAIWEIPRFSTNTVTFSGEVTISGTPASDGSQYSYDITDLDAVDNFTIDVTGKTHRQNATTSGTARNGESVPFHVGGTADPERAEVTISGHLASGAGNEEWASSHHSPNDSIALDAENGMVYSGGHDSRVVASFPSNGSADWSTSLSAEISAVEYYSGTVYAGLIDGTLVALSASDGTKQWSTAIHTNVINAIDDNGTMLFTGSDDGDVKGVAPANGTVIWTMSYMSKIKSLEYYNGQVYAGDDAYEVHALNSDGVEQWTSTSPTDTIRGLAAGDGRAYAVQSGHAWAFDETDGSIVWDGSTGSSTSEAIGFGSHYTVWGQNTEGAVIDVRDSSDRRHVYKGSAPRDWPTQIETMNGRIFTVDGDGYVTASTFAHESRDPSVAVNGKTIVSHSGFLPDGNTVAGSAGTEVTLGDDTMDVSTSMSTQVGTSIEVEEITETVNPTIEVNGQTTSYSGTLADGQTASLSTNTSWVQEANTVNVTVSSAYDGPTGQVSLDYSHESVDNQSVSYDGEVWSERYNVSRTYASNRSNAQLEIPFQGSVIGIRTLEIREDGGTWQTVAESNYALDGTDLTVDLGSVTANTTVDVRTAGTKVNPVNGSITVTDPTVLEDDLATEFEITSYSSGFNIEVNATAYGDDLHYTYDESYSGAESYARGESGGAQAVYMPNAGAGDSARVGTVPLEPQPSTGHVDVRVESAGSEPEFTVMSSTTSSDIAFVWKDTTSGNEYQLYSLDADEERSRATASSPVQLLHDGTAETLKIFDLGSGGGGGGGGAAPAQVSGDSLPLTQPERLILVIGVVLAGLFVVSRRTGDSSITGKMVLYLAAPIAAVLAFSSLAPERMVAEIALGLRENLSLILLFAGAALYLWYRQRKAPDTRVSFNLRNR